MWAKLEVTRVLNLIFAQLDITTPSELFIKHTRYDLFTSATLKQMGYEKHDLGWFLKGDRPQRAPVDVPPPPPPIQDQGPPADTPLWFIPFHHKFSTFNRDTRLGLQSLRVDVSSLHTTYSSLDQYLTRIEKYQANLSRGIDSMDTSSASRSDDDESEEGSEEGDEEEGEDEEKDEEEVEEEDDDANN
ncbi:uncharacterized protein LOC131155940 [Malania oleifera]|uniref:uncharacterized protein LOC131155940 n=1 Tax=Malania oleifera TaxID=397392 RepID=UPI0025AE2F20|nr:uncharacterized protein LOC131155940 [Malania oleifera]